MIREEEVSYATFLELVDKQQWLDSDIEEAYKLTNRTIPQLFKDINKNQLLTSVMYDDDVVLSIIALDYCNQLTYFNTIHVKKHLRGYLVFLKQMVQRYVKERSYLTVWSLKSYTTTTKKLKYLGFRQSIREFRRLKWVAQQKQ